MSSAPREPAGRGPLARTLCAASLAIPRHPGVWRPHERKGVAIFIRPRSSRGTARMSTWPASVEALTRPLVTSIDETVALLPEDALALLCIRQLRAPAPKPRRAVVVRPWRPSPSCPAANSPARC